MKSDPEYIYFDLDDTLLNHKKAEARALADIHAFFNWFDPVDRGWLVKVYHDINRKQWERYGAGRVTRDQLQRNRFEMTLAQLGLDRSRYEEVGSFYMERYREHWSWNSGAKDAFHRVGEKYPVGILTNGFSETQKQKIETFELGKTADHLVISEDVGFLKPDPRIFSHATDLAGCRAADILYVGDSLSSDVAGGYRFGWNVAWYFSGGENKKPEKAVLSFSDFNKLLEFLKI